ncbi:Gfo/Idh/MocA family oxidoreductase [Cytobacillus pseudoceanisediminis]|uniref:Gfo/Idh/MocA family oxidoreductase n=1 Tax=Cytobacillus pseudoceanisediminis TaxID=3051614 RepID=UPI00364F8B7C
MKLALIGGGNIGRFLLQSINIDCLIPNAKIIGLHTRCQEQAKELSREFEAEIFEDVESLLKSDADLVIEAATVEAVEEYAASILLSGKDLVVSSVGALADREFYKCLEEICILNNTKIHLPSGAIGGLDVLKAAKSIGELDSVSITGSLLRHFLVPRLMGKRCFLRDLPPKPLDYSQRISMFPLSCLSRD